MKTLSKSLAIAALGLAASWAHAGGPLGVCNNAPLKYAGTGSVTLSYDGGGTLGSRTKAQADAIVSAASAKWTDVGTSTVAITRGADLPVDVTISNYASYYGKYSDGINPVIYDSDGSIVDAILGSGQKNSILGFAGSAWYGSPNCRYTEGQAVINGYRSVSDTTLTNVIAHELGHLIGLDHSQLDATQGLAGSNYPLMYPIAYRTLSVLHDDDAAAVSALYPGTLGSTYGTLNGYFRLSDNVTPVRGANIWARETSTGRVISVVSDYLQQNTGYFSMLLPPGTYTLQAEAIASDFSSGSSVGPYSESYPSSPSFQSPLYVNGAPMATLTLGNATPVQFAITAGCTANATFRFDGTGAVTGNCGTASAGGTTAARLANLSTRGQVLTGDNVMIAGFIIGGSTAKTVAINVAGPSLVSSGIANPLANPMVTLIRSADNAVIATNDNWGSAANASQIQASGFAPSNSLEPAILATLAPGAYTAIVQGSGGGTGVALVGVFEVDHPEAPLSNISTRGYVSTGNDVMIGGFIIQGTSPQTVVVRARGPSFTSLGVAGALSNPTLTLVRSSDNAVIATNDNWGSAANASQIQASGFAPSSSLEPAILVTLNPGAYTAIVSGAGGVTGVGSVEVFAAQ